MDCRTYDDGTVPEGHQIALKCDEWVQWMLDVTEQALRVTDGAVVWIASGATRGRNYLPACEGLMWEWYKRGGHAYRPCYWHRVGIPGSGGDQWFRADVEYAMCFKREGPLPWTDNTVMGHKPKYAPGGAMSHRLGDGTRRNQWGHSGKGSAERSKRGERQLADRPSHRPQTKSQLAAKTDPEDYAPPTLANPGNLFQENESEFWQRVQWMAEAWENQASNLVYTTVGGGHLGDKIAHENEAPFPERLAEFFIRSLCPPGGTVLDCFSGSGTTAKVAKTTGRHAIGIDLRSSQVDLSNRRVSTDSANQASLF
ncbi:MAG: site-specific DNA-methyltransferase, partial [Planctomycetota bacterium]